jgi:2-dehydropantoate 2-reductase
MNSLNTDKIFIIGAGAIGKSLAVFLQLAGREVVLLRGSVSNTCYYTEEISVEMPDGVIYTAKIKIATPDYFSQIEGTIVLANKSFGNERLAGLLKNKINHSPIVLLQNGLGVERSFIEHNFTNIYRCVLFVTCQVLNDKLVRFKPVDSCPVGTERGNAGQLENIVNQLTTEYFKFNIEENIATVVWKKTIVNCVFNSVCSLLEADNGIFYRSETALMIAQRIISECRIIAKEKEINLSQEEITESLLKISKLSDGQLISTLQDIRNHRETEIDTLNAEIVRIAAQINKLNEVKETRLLGELVKLKANTNHS